MKVTAISCVGLLNMVLGLEITGLVIFMLLGWLVVFANFGKIKDFLLD